MHLNRNVSNYQGENITRFNPPSPILTVLHGNLGMNESRYPIDSGLFSCPKTQIEATSGSDNKRDVSDV